MNELVIGDKFGKGLDKLLKAEWKKGYDKGSIEGYTVGSITTVIFFVFLSVLNGIHLDLLRIVLYVFYFQAMIIIMGFLMRKLGMFDFIRYYGDRDG